MFTYLYYIQYVDIFIVCFYVLFLVDSICYSENKA